MILNLKRSKTLQISILALSLILISTGCGNPTNEFVSFKEDGVYFTVPTEWHAISNQELSDYEAKSTDAGAAVRLAAVKWQVAYSPSPTIKPTDVFSIAAKESPIVFLRIRNLYPSEVNAVSFNALRDIVLPLTSWIDGSLAAPKFTLLDDENFNDKGATGKRSVFTFAASNDKLETINQTVALSPDRTVLYVLIVRCSATCYTQNQSTLDKITDSFTIRGR